jgi:hypothetical protein
MKIIIKRIKVDFISWRQVSALIDRFVKQAFKKQWPNEKKGIHLQLFLSELDSDEVCVFFS